MRLEHAKEEIDIVSRLRNFENAFVKLFARHGGFVLARIRERNLQRQFFCYEIDPSQPQHELLQKTAEHEKERLGCFDLVLEFEALPERLRRSNQFKQSLGLPVGALPHSDCFGPESCAKLLPIQGCKLPKCMDPPFV